MGHWEIRRLIESGYRDEIINYAYKLLELIQFKIDEVRLTTNPNVTQAIVIMDMAELSWWKVSSREVLQVCLKVFHDL